ncbi:hypothetical protein ABTM23_19585, partial [Acinetobacter baumannii]
SDDEGSKFSAGAFVNRDNSTFITLDMLDKDLIGVMGKLKPGDLSEPISYTDERSGKKGVRIVYYKTKKEPHRENLKDDYNRI